MMRLAREMRNKSGANFSPIHQHNGERTWGNPIERFPFLLCTPSFVVFLVFFFVLHRRAKAKNKKSVIQNLSQVGSESRGVKRKIEGKLLTAKALRTRKTRNDMAKLWNLISSDEWFIKSQLHGKSLQQILWHENDGGVLLIGLKHFLFTFSVPALHFLTKLGELNWANERHVFRCCWSSRKDPFSGLRPRSKAPHTTDTPSLTVGSINVRFELIP